MGLDINTEKGQETIKQEVKMLQYIKKSWGVEIKITKKDKPIPHDGILLIDDEVVGVFECKNRQTTLEELEGWGSWLITYSKLEKCREIAKELKVPLFGFLGIEKDNLIMYWKITDVEGNYLFDFEHFVSETQATVNGGVANRDNAFLPIKYGNFVQPNQQFPTQ